jgi:hypothetical protein
MKKIKIILGIILVLSVLISCEAGSVKHSDHVTQGLIKKGSLIQKDETGTEYSIMLIKKVGFNGKYISGESRKVYLNAFLSTPLRRDGNIVAEEYVIGFYDYHSDYTDLIITQDQIVSYAVSECYLGDLEDLEEEYVKQ